MQTLTISGNFSKPFIGNVFYYLNMGYFSVNQDYNDCITQKKYTLTTTKMIVSFFHFVQRPNSFILWN